MFGIRSWLVLGRISNLTTVWANALCAWILGGTGATGNLISVIVGLSLLYIAGMYLNDYCDTNFDRKHRQERPIPSGKVKRHSVLVATLLFFFSGTALISWAGTESVVYAFVLIALIVGYNLVHKHSAMLGVPLMASCRSNVYLVTGAASQDGINPLVWTAAALMFFFIFGITLLARNESTSRKAPSMGYIFLIMPMVGVLYLAAPHYETTFLITFFPATLWIAVAFYQARKTGSLIIGKAIGPLLAGICLIDLAILTSMSFTSLFAIMLFWVLFIFTLLAQKIIPAT